MSTHKYFDRICVVALVLSLLLTMVFVNGEVLGIRAADTVMGYEDRLFDSSAVHTIDIVIDDWDGFLQTAQSEEYAACSVVIDGEAFKNVGIRGKGNTSLSTVSSMNSQRYSFKLEFDQYDTGKTYHGLDKLSLNNLIQDTTYLKDYLTYRMMAEFGAAAPLCSFVWITVNGEDWGLYLAVEAVEESFLQRNYGSDYGELYKPDSMNFGGGRGNGKDFNMEDF
ncbi:MAG: CotH kinase family protein, partial [Clostridia bacterium]|nr:CotH kinase family protein [Clostridia bacterium]